MNNFVTNQTEGITDQTEQIILKWLYKLAEWYLG